MVSGILVEDIIPKKGGQCSFYLKLPKIKVFKEKIGSKFDTTVNKEKVEKSIQSTGAVFTWGANSFEEMADLAKGFHKVKNDNIVRGLEVVNPVYKLVTWMPFVKKIAQKIIIFSKNDTKK